MEKNTYQKKINDLQKYGNSSLSYLTLSDDLNIFTGKWRGFIAFKQYFKTLVVLGDPIVPISDLDKALRDFRETQTQKKKHICFFVNSEMAINDLVKNGFKGFLVGNEAVVTLSNFSITGRKGWKIRSSVNYANKIGY